MRGGDVCALCEAPMTRGEDRARWCGQAVHLSCLDPEDT